MKPTLIAGIGNIFLGDDAFGCEVVHALSFSKLPEGVEVIDFGIRSYDLACALTADFQTVILVDATPRGQPPGTTCLLEIDTAEIASLPASETVNAHSINIVSALQLARALGSVQAKLYLVGCEPSVLEVENDELGLSLEVRRAVPEALELIHSLLGDLAIEQTKTEPGLVPV